MNESNKSNVGSYPSSLWHRSALEILDRLVAMRSKSDKEAKMNLDQLKVGGSMGKMMEN